jgi:signal transduction histidine kinase
MNFEGKTREQLIAEVAELRVRLSELDNGTSEDLSEDLLRLQLDLAVRLNQVSELSDTLRLSVEAARSIAGMDAGGIYMVDETSGDLNLAVSEGLPDKILKELSHYPANSPNTQLVMEGEPIHIDYQELEFSIDQALTEVGFRASSAYPISCEGKVIACLNVSSRTLNQLSPARRDALETIVSQAGNAIARARAEEALKQSAEMLRIQRDLILAFGSAPGLEEVMKHSLQYVFQIEELDCGGVYLLEHRTGGLDLIVHEGLPREFVQAVSHVDSTSPGARLVLKGEPIYTHHSELGIPMDDVRAEQGLRALAIIPFKDEGRVIGVLNLASRTNDEISTSARNTLEAMAGLIGGAIARAQAEKEKATLQEMLRHSEKMQAIGQLAGGVAHDFNNQLMGIVGSADLLRFDLKNDSKLAHFVDNILLAANRAADLTEQLLAFARKGKYLSMPIDIHRTIVEVVSLLQHSVDKRITTTKELKADSHVVDGDPTQLQNALLNLALNACDAMPAGGILSFTTQVAELDQHACDTTPFEIEPGRFIQISVTDSGAGIDEAILDHIFEPFYTTKDPGKGTGMGLAAVYGTVKSHRGSIDVHSEVGRSTTFEMYLPLSKKASAHMAEAISTIDAVDKRAHILLVDDEEIVRDVTCTLLRRLGYRVTESSNGADAVRLYRAQWEDIDLVLLDMVMPDMGGRDAFIAMRKMNPKLKVLLASGYSIDGEAQGILDEGAKAFIQKPFTLDQLARDVEDVLE